MQQYFSNLSLDDSAKRREFSKVAILWFLVSQTSTNYHWLDKFEDLLNDFPILPNTKVELMGFNREILEKIK